LIAYTRRTALCIRCGATALKGQGKGDASDFARISWDEALNEISSRFKKISDEFGPEAILPYSYAGNMGVLSYSGMAHRFFHRLGASQLDRTICASAGGAGMQTVIGRNCGNRARTISGFEIHHCMGRKYSRHQTCICGRSLPRHGAMAPNWW